ncbi:glycosyltransferase family 4 protein [Pseudomonas sp. NyZ704]|nr:glycosyltransferase family 4 protein [Pseudomonas sp. NyZ704]
MKAAGYDVHLVVADGKGDALKEKVHIVDAGLVKAGRLARMIYGTRQVFRKALALEGDIYHLHDPELLPVAVKLKALGKRVIFDSHEDFPADIMSKPYLGKAARILVSTGFSVYERRVCKKLDYIISATPAIKNKFNAIGCSSIDINNYPLSEELADLLPWDADRDTVCYIGAMTSIRGVPQLVDAMQEVRTPSRLALVGRFTEAKTGEICKSNKGWHKVEEHGFLDRNAVRSIMSRSFAGLVTFLPAPNHVDAQPNKMFEYMSAGIPVIGSHFPLWKEIIEGNNCGICVDPEMPASIAEAISYLAENQQLAKQMGANGRQAVLQKYNWDSEALKLIDLYERILAK